MPPQIPNQVTSDSLQKCPWYQPLCKVTPLSKYLAMAIFIALPFVGGYVGYRLAPEKVVEVAVPVVNQVQTTPVALVPNQPEALTDIPIDAQHILFNNRKTGYFILNGRVYYGHVDGTVNTEGIDYDWVVHGPASLVADADPTSFKVIASEPAEIGSLYAIDSLHAYTGTTTLENVDIASVAVFGKGGAFLLSSKGIYVFGKLYIPIGPGNDTQLFFAKDNSYSIYIQSISNDTWRVGIYNDGHGGSVKNISKPNRELLSEPVIF